MTKSMTARMSLQKTHAVLLVLGMLGSLSAGSRAVAEEKHTPAATPATPLDSPSRTLQEPSPSLTVQPEYKIGEQDVLNIDVWHEKELSGSVVVRPDGKITIPLINEIYVVGMTPPQLQKLITQKLTPYVTVPQVTVSVREINSRQVYVIGEVARRGVFRINSNTTVLQLLAAIGGPLDYAKRKRIYVLRTENGRQVRLPFNYDEVIRGKRFDQNILLRPGDTVVVP